MAMFVWISAATAIWHFTIFVPDKFVGGIVGALLWANGGGVLAGVLASGVAVPLHANMIDALEALLGAVAGLYVGYWLGDRPSAREHAEA